MSGYRQPGEKRIPSKGSRRSVAKGQRLSDLPPEDRAAEEHAPVPLDEYGNPLYCWGKRRQGPGRCHRSPGHGTNHPGVGKCKLHGGSVPSGVKSAQMELQRREVKRLGLSINVTPHEALLANVRLRAGTVAYLNSQVSQCDPDELVEGGPGAMWYALLKEAQRDLTTDAAAAARAGVEERQVRLAEQQAELLITTIRNVLSDLGITETPQVLQTMQRRLLESSHLSVDATSPFDRDVDEEVIEVEMPLAQDDAEDDPDD